MRAIIERHLSSKLGRYIINTVGIAYLLVLVMEYGLDMKTIGGIRLPLLENILNLLFLIELALRVYVYRGDFFKKMLVINLPKRPAKTNESAS